VIGLIRMVKFLMTRAIRIKPSIDGHLFVVDIPSVVSQSGQAAFPSLPYSQKGRRDPGHKEVCDRLRSVRGGDPLGRGKKVLSRSRFGDRRSDQARQLFLILSKPCDVLRGRATIQSVTNTIGDKMTVKPRLSNSTHDLVRSQRT
jgi:hypothetical protein